MSLTNFKLEMQVFFYYQNNVGSRDVHVYLGLLFCLSKTELSLWIKIKHQGQTQIKLIKLIFLFTI